MLVRLSECYFVSYQAHACSQAVMVSIRYLEMGVKKMTQISARSDRLRRKLNTKKKKNARGGA